MTFRTARTSQTRSSLSLPMGLRSATMVYLTLSMCAVSVAPAQMSQSDNPQSPQYAPPTNSLFAPFRVYRSYSSMPLPAIPMPQDRAADSYGIYTVLLPVGQLANAGWSRQMWLLSDTTLPLVAPDESCLPQGDDGLAGSNMNPHTSIFPPAEGQQDYNEMLSDFDNRCHERIRLTPESFNLVVPLRLLNQNEQDEFVATRFDPAAGEYGDMLAARYHGAPGISSFSQVFFNAHHTVAMVYASGWCGGVCAQSYWQVLGLENGQWKKLHWNAIYVSS
jgi:hypothetical protein